jgi:nitroreductase
MTTPRIADHKIEPIFLERWSPRAFTSEEISESDLRSMFEAARWAPSSYNSQPWRFVYARRGDANWDKLLSLLIEFNQSWAKAAAALVFVVSSETMPGKDGPVSSRSHAFDTGAAWGYLALQAAHMGWHAHAMVGIEWARVNEGLNVPPGHHVQAAIAIGKKGPTSQLPEALQPREAPSPRKPQTEFLFEGGFKCGVAW